MCSSDLGACADRECVNCRLPGCPVEELTGTRRSTADAGIVRNNTHRISMNKIVLLLALSSATSTYAQVLSFGVKGGEPLLDAYQNHPSGDYQRRYIVGPTAEIHLPFHLSFEVDALYRRSGTASTNITYAFGGPPSPAVEVVQRSRVNDWQIPFLAKWEHGSGPIRPFIDAGVTYRHVSGTSTAEYFSPFGSTSQTAAATTTPNSDGFTFGGGVTLKLLVVRVSPEFRYTRWHSPPLVGIFLASNMNANQADLLVGFTF